MPDAGRSRGIASRKIRKAAADNTEEKIALNDEPDREKRKYSVISSSAGEER